MNGRWKLSLAAALLLGTAAVAVVVALVTLRVVAPGHMYWASVTMDPDGVPASVSGTPKTAVRQSSDAYFVTFPTSVDLRNCAAVASVGSGTSTVVVQPWDTHNVFVVAREAGGATVQPNLFSLVVTCD
jgi:hypothetical protein